MPPSWWVQLLIFCAAVGLMWLGFWTYGRWRDIKDYEKFWRSVRRGAMGDDDEW